MIRSLKDIEQYQGFAGAEARAAAELRPRLAHMVFDPVGVGRQQKIITRYILAAFFAFIVSFIALGALLPDGAGWPALTFVLFPVLFIAYMTLALFLIRGRLARLFAEAQARLAVKADVMRRLAAPLGLAYVPAPGGAPRGLEWLAKQSWAPAILQEAAARLNAAGGMDGAVEVVRACGLMIEANTHIVGTPEQKARYHRQAAGMRRIEDGFEGTRAGLAFSMFEWVETVSDAPDVYHHIIVLRAPMRLQGVTHLRARKTSWPQDPDGAPMQDVELGPRSFDAHYRLRSSDQVEARAIFNPAVIERVTALANGGPFRAVARQQHLVFDFASEANRFHLIDLITGHWSDDTIRQAHADLAEALDLVDALGHAFMLARKPDTGSPS